VVKSGGERQAVVLGYDMVSPLGTDMETQWRRAAAGESGVGPLTRFPLDETFPVRIAGEVPDFDPAPYPFLSPRALALWPSPLFRHGLLTVHRALEHAGLEIAPELAPRTAVTFGSAVGGLDAVLGADRRMRAEGRMPHPCANPNSCVNMIGGKVSMLTGATGPICATITACATGATSMLMGALLLETGRADVAICGAVDFALVEPIVAGFATMNGAWTPKPGEPDIAPQAACRPFSAGRRGFVVSEGSGAVILSTRAFARAHGLGMGIAVAGGSMTSDAHHFVAPHLETVRRCMAEAIRDAGISPADVDAVNAHATSTRIGDRVEYEALRAVFGGNLPPVSANKSLTGHAMGASSAIESIWAMEGMRRGLLLPTRNYIPDPEMPLDPVAEGLRKRDQEFVLKNAFGFGGCNTCIVFQRTGP
jgi:3-oxoacyl-[acyl-carrier-protein] synthase II